MMNENNPLFVRYATPHETAPFNKITLQDFEEAMLEGIRREDEQIDKIINNPEPPTFDNTVIDINSTDEEDFYYSLLDRATSIFFNLLSAETNDEMDALAQKMSPILSKHANDLHLNRQFFERLKAVYDLYHVPEGCPKPEPEPRPLTSEEMLLLENSYEGFQRSGALLDEEGKEKLRKMSEESSRLSLQFSQNVLKETKAYKLIITDEAQLDGLPQSSIDSAASAYAEYLETEKPADDAPEKGWLFTLDSPSYGPFLMYSTQRELRRQMYMARNRIGINGNSENNLDVCKRIINLRRERAQLLGFDTFADFVMKRRMASSVDNVYALLNKLIDAYKPTAVKERQEVIDMAKRIEGEDFKMEPWDSAYYSHKLKMERYNIDPEMFRPYLKLENVINGVFGLATRLYGITFKPNTDIPVYHPDVKAYEVFDKDGSFLAVFYADFHPRKGKRDGAWMTSYEEQYIDNDGVNHRPHVSVVMNLTKPTADKPALLTLGEVETFLHEFGHSLHGMFANTRFCSLSGTNVWWDFVELPSQFMENYILEPEFLNTFAAHCETGEPIPEDLIQRLITSRNYGVGGACLRQVSFGLLDLAYYTMKEEFNADIISFEKKAWEKTAISPQRTDTCMTTQFSHIMAGGYAAGYYSYKWAEVLDADAFAVFKKEGIFNPETAQRFRECILSKGGTEHPMTLYKRFKGSEPTINALMERNGIATPEA